MVSGFRLTAEQLACAERRTQERRGLGALLDVEDVRRKWRRGTDFAFGYADVECLLLEIDRLRRPWYRRLLAWWNG